MSGIITKRSLPRRTVLRGLGATLALPLLDSMVPALAAAKEKMAVRRLGAIYVPNGVEMRAWTPAGTGTALELTSTRWEALIPTMIPVLRSIPPSIQTSP